MCSIKKENTGNVNQESLEGCFEINIYHEHLFNINLATNWNWIDDLTSEGKNNNLNFSVLSRCFTNFKYGPVLKTRKYCPANCSTFPLVGSINKYKSVCLIDLHNICQAIASNENIFPFPSGYTNICCFCVDLFAKSPTCRVAIDTVHQIETALTLKFSFLSLNPLIINYLFSWQLTVENDHLSHRTCYRRHTALSLTARI